MVRSVDVGTLDVSRETEVEGGRTGTRETRPLRSVYGIR